jgi:hypothetical protein
MEATMTDMQVVVDTVGVMVMTIEVDMEVVDTVVATRTAVDTVIEEGVDTEGMRDPCIGVGLRLFLTSRDH